MWKGGLVILILVSCVSGDFLSLNPLDIDEYIEWSLPDNMNDDELTLSASMGQLGPKCQSRCKEMDRVLRNLKTFLPQLDNDDDEFYNDESYPDEDGSSLRRLDNQNKRKVEEFLRTYQPELSKHRRRFSLSSWKKDTNLTTYNIQQADKEDLKFTKWLKQNENYARNHLTLDGLDCTQTKMLKSVRKTSEVKEPNLKNESVTLSSRIKRIYSEAEVCKNTEPKKCYAYEPGIINIMAKSRDYDTLLWVWKGWRDAIGPNVKDDWIRVNEIDNIGARENGYADEGQYWRSTYDVDGFRNRIHHLWEEIKPLYKQLHAFVRYRLHQQYGDRVNLTGPIPAHILGDIWGMQWNNIYDICEPYKGVGGFDVTDGMKDRNYTVHELFTLANDFYKSIGLPAMPQSFWDKSMFTRPPNRPVACYASASNMEKTDVRLKMCAQVNQEYFYVAHHEMGHCQYYLAYNLHQPELFQDGANPGFHEAIGDTAALSVINPTHLKKLGIITNEGDAVTKPQRRINFLMKIALQKLAFYPFAMIVDMWRWKVYSGEIKTNEMNSAWWRERLKHEGIIPPVERTEHDFDPSSKYHITYRVPYIRYFISHILQFQFYEKMCNDSGYKGPLYLCDFAASTKAGNPFKKMLRDGSSRHWEDTLYEMTGSCRMDVGAMKRFFDPLIKWLVKENKRLGNKIGWE